MVVNIEKVRLIWWLNQLNVFFILRWLMVMKIIIKTSVNGGFCCFFMANDG